MQNSSGHGRAVDRGRFAHWRQDDSGGSRVVQREALERGAGDKAAAAYAGAGAGEPAGNSQPGGEKAWQAPLKAKATATAVRDPVTTMVLALQEIQEYLKNTRDAQGVSERVEVIKAKKDAEVYKLHLIALLAVLKDRDDFSQEEDEALYRCWKLINDGNA